MKRLTQTFFGAMAVLTVALVSCVPRSDHNPEPGPSISSTSPSAAPSATVSPSKSYTLAQGSCPSPVKADRTSADSTAYYYTYITHCWDSMLDTSKTDAVLRASDLMSKDWLETQKSATGIKNTSQNSFVAAKKIEGYSVPSVNKTVGDVDQDVAADKAARGFTTDWYWQSRASATQQPGGRDQIIVYLEKRAGQWEVVGDQVTSSEEK